MDIQNKNTRKIIGCIPSDENTHSRIPKDKNKERLILNLYERIQERLNKYSFM